MTKQRLRLLLAVVATIAVLAPLGYFWQQSRMPGTYSVMDMGYGDYGGGDRGSTDRGAGHDMDGHAMDGGVSVADLVEPSTGPADVVVDLVARKERFELASGREVDGYTINGTSPGPTIEATVGDLVEVKVRNESVSDGVSVHWHGIDVPNAEDGVAGVTQNAIKVGEDYTYRFVVEQVGTYWYHSHQVSHTQVLRGMLGALVVHPKRPDDRLDVTALAHTYSGTRTLNGEEGVVTVDAEPGQVARLRIINTDVGTVQVWTESPYTVLAIDGYDVNEPTRVEGPKLAVPPGGRADLEVTAPARVQIGGATAIVLGEGPSDEPKPVEPQDNLDLLSYGGPEPVPFDISDPDRQFDYRIGRRPGFVDGKPGLWWSINGHLWPDVPMFMVDEGDVVTFTIKNTSGQAHPMHLHGHHAVVLSRDGKKATGSPWWIDSLDVEDGEEFEIAFLADNPGIWMDHCHNLTHAAQGLIAHLMYSGVTEPYLLGDDSGNEPE